MKKFLVLVVVLFGCEGTLDDAKELVLLVDAKVIANTEVVSTEICIKPGAKCTPWATYILYEGTIKCSIYGVHRQQKIVFLNGEHEVPIKDSIRKDWLVTLSEIDSKNIEENKHASFWVIDAPDTVEVLRGELVRSKDCQK
jgi:hypothetical protein